MSLEDKAKNWLRSSHREALLEHLFAGEIMKRLWLKDITRVEILKPQVDDSGYDLVLEASTVATDSSEVQSIVRHVQLKSSFKGSTIRTVKVSRFLQAKPSGCVVFIWFDPETLVLGPFDYFGGAPGKSLKSIKCYPIAKAAKANAKGVKAERPNMRVVPLSDFERVLDWDALLAKLFGSILPRDDG
jgi:hypothetical protein